MKITFDFLPLENHEINWLARVLVTDDTFLDGICPAMGIEFMQAVKSEIEDRQLGRRSRCIADIMFEGPVDQWADQVCRVGAWCILLADDRDQNPGYGNVAALLTNMADQLTNHLKELTDLHRGTGGALGGDPDAH